MTCQFTTTGVKLNYLLKEGLDIKVIKQKSNLALIEITVSNYQDVQKLIYAGAHYGADCMVEYGKVNVN